MERDSLTHDTLWCNYSHLVKMSVQFEDQPGELLGDGEFVVVDEADCAVEDNNDEDDERSEPMEDEAARPDREVETCFGAEVGTETGEIF